MCWLSYLEVDWKSSRVGVNLPPPNKIGLIVKLQTHFETNLTHHVTFYHETAYFRHENLMFCQGNV